MKKSTLCLIALTLLLGAVIFMSISTLSLHASEEYEAKWAEVCCGSACGTPYCIGVGPYTCCR